MQTLQNVPSANLRRNFAKRGLLLFAPIVIHTSTIASAQTVNESPRYISGNRVALRISPDTDGKVLGQVARGDQVARIGNEEINGFCLIRPKNWASLDIRNGERIYVACRYLSATPVLSASLEDANANMTRYVVGIDLNLRSAPDIKSKKLNTLRINTKLMLLDNVEKNGFCAVDIENIGSGYVACRYLGRERAELEPTPKHDDITNAERNFNLLPSYGRLLAYAGELERKFDRNGDAKVVGDPLPTDNTLERMRSMLKKGVIHQAPIVLREKLTHLRQRLHEKISRCDRIDKPDSDACGDEEGYNRYSPIYGWGMRNPQALAWLKNVKLPEISPSAFHTVDEVTVVPFNDFSSSYYWIADSTEVESLSAFYQIPVSTIITKKPVEASALDERGEIGTWDMNEVTQKLIQPVYQHRLTNEGVSESSPFTTGRTFAAGQYLQNEPCDGFVPGFHYGNAEELFFTNTTSFNNPASRKLINRFPRGQLFTFYTKQPMRFVKAKPNSIKQKTGLIQSAGFSQVEVMSFDINGDGVPDFAVIKNTSTHDDSGDKPVPFGRVFLINIKGEWHTLGADLFDYSCNPNG